MSEELRRRKLDLPCKLTFDEVEEKQGELVEWTKIRGEREVGLERWKADKRDEQKLYEGEIMSAAARLVRTAKIIEEEKEYRLIEVVDTIHGSTVTTFRDDTGEIVGERPATDSELQTKLNLPPARHVDEVDEAAEAIGEVVIGAPPDDEPKEEEPDADEDPS